MKKRNVLDWLPHGILISLLLVGYTTKTAKDTEQSYHTAGATGAVLGTGVSLPKGRTYLKIMATGSGGTARLSRVYITGDDLEQSPDTIGVGIGAPFDGFFPNGVDSLAIVAIAAGDTLQFTTSN